MLLVATATGEGTSWLPEWIQSDAVRSLVFLVSMNSSITGHELPFGFRNLQS